MKWKTDKLVNTFSRSSLQLESVIGTLMYLCVLCSTLLTSFQVKRTMDYKVDSSWSNTAMQWEGTKGTLIYLCIPPSKLLISFQVKNEEKNKEISW